MRILAIPAALLRAAIAGACHCSAIRQRSRATRVRGQPIIRHNVWVEVPDVDTDRDGAHDRIRVQISRPDATERGTKLPIILVASPYSGGTRPYPQHDINVALFVPGAPAADQQGRCAVAAAPSRRRTSGTSRQSASSPPAAIRRTSFHAGSSSRTPIRWAQVTPPAVPPLAVSRRTWR